VAVFGNAGGGKSALAQRLAELTGLPLYVVDMMQFKPGGAKVPHDEFLQAHADIPLRDEWIIDGFGNMAIAWERFAAADTLIHVDLPLFVHSRWITKRLIKGLFGGRRVCWVFNPPNQYSPAENRRLAPSWWSNGRQIPCSRRRCPISRGHGERGRRLRHRDDHHHRVGGRLEAGIGFGVCFEAPIMLVIGGRGIRPSGD
jgi:hypothetical protein